MAISAPLDLLTDFPGWSPVFELLYRQEQSRHASGRTRVKDFGSPLWTATYTTRNLRPSVLDYWRAKLASAENGLVEFTAWPIARSRPINHQGSGSLPTGELHTIDANNKAVRVDDLDGISLAIGDYVQIGTDLHQVMEPAVAVSGLTPLFEIRPHLWPGVTVGDVVKISKPACLMTVVPGSVSAQSDLRGWGSISWQAIESRG
jgi:hypothetical protein